MIHILFILSINVTCVSACETRQRAAGLRNENMDKQDKQDEQDEQDSRLKQEAESQTPLDHTSCGARGGSPGTHGSKPITLENGVVG